ncbi:DUF167 family protein [Pelagibacterium sp.]|uniref:DUF167 family protein n=1 Tax=Pelagibacterium sp. TaxID=1967288 RepID=UPI003A8F3EE2
MSPACYTLTADGARINLRVTPNARTNTLEGPRSRADGTCVLAVRVCAQPDKGAANTAVIALLAKALSLPKSAITISSGQTGRSKVILAKGSPEDLGAALDSLTDR